MVTLENVATAVSGLVIAYEIGRQARHFLRRRIAFSWDDVERWVDSLYAKLQEADVLPDLIVGIGRGGAVAAGMISTRYRDDPNNRHLVIPIATIDRVYVNGEPVIVGVHHLNVHDKRVLLLNADSYSGLTLYRARQVLGYAGPAELKTGSLVDFKGKDAYRPDFVGREYPKERRLPWRRGKPREGRVSAGEPNTLVVLNGLVATGKTSVADSLVKQLGYQPVYSDWYWFSSGLQDRDSNPVTNQHHNDHMIALCWSAAVMGRNVVLDTTSRWRALRDQIQAEGNEYGIRVIFVRCRCPEEASMARIQNRKHIGPNDFGTAYEYGRIKRDFQAVDEQELEQRNLIEVDTDGLHCSIANALGTADRREMLRLIEAIQAHYFSQISSTDDPPRDPPRDA